MQRVIESKQNFLTRLCFVIMFVVIFLGCTTTARAGTLTYIQSTVDLNTWEVLTAVVRENVGLTAHSPEVRRVDADVLKSLSNNSASLSNSVSALSGLSSYVNSYDNSDNYDGIKVNGNAFGGLVGAGEKYRVLTFPGKGGKSETADYNRAFIVNDALIYDLNQAFSLWLDAKGYTKTPKLEDFYNRMKEFLNSISISGDYCTVSGVDGEFRWRIAKGYTSTEHDSTLKNISEDADYINWGMIVYEAFNNYLLEGDEAVTDQTVFSANPGQLEKTLVFLCSSLLDGLTSLLGLWSIDELMFNTGIRTYGYVGGIFPNGWESTIWTLFIIAEVLAAMILMFGIINRVLQRAMTTVNTFARLRAMQQIQDIVVCAIALALLPLILRVIISMSQDFTGMIYELVPTNSATGEKYKIAQMVMRYTNGGGTLAGCIAQFLFFGVQVYFNFFYMLRSLMIAFLIIIAPIMVSMIMVSDSKKQMAILWSKELLANILIQPIHAFIMATILLLPNSSHGFDNVIALYALIPLTAALRSMFFGGSGSLMDKAAETAKGKFTGSVSNAALKGGATAAAFAGGKIGQVLESRKDSKGEQSDSGGDPGDLSRKTSTTSNGTTSNNAGMNNGTDGVLPAENMDSGSGLDGMPMNTNAVNNNTDSIPAAAGKVAGFVTEAALGVSGKASDVARGVVAGAGRIAENIKSPKNIGGLAKGVALGAGRVIKNNALGVSGIGLAALGGAVAGAGLQGGQSIATMGMNMASYRPKNEPKKDDDKKPDGVKPNFEKPDLSSIKDVPNSIELGNNNSGFENMGEIPMGKNEDIMKQRYYADEDALTNMGIDNIKDIDGAISFNVNPDRSPEAAEFGAYADYCKYLTDNDRGAERIELQRNTGISATRTDDGVKVSINKKNWRAARNNGSTKYDESGTNIRVGKDFRTQTPTGMYVEGPVGQAQSLLGGMKVNNPTPNSANGSVEQLDSNRQVQNTPHTVSFSEVMKSPENFAPSQYTPEPASFNPSPDSNIPEQNNINNNANINNNNANNTNVNNEINNNANNNNDMNNEINSNANNNNVDNEINSNTNNNVNNEVERQIPDINEFNQEPLIPDFEPESDDFEHSFDWTS